MKRACVGVLSIIELKNARWNIEKFTHQFNTQWIMYSQAVL